jgi:protein ImuB
MVFQGRYALIFRQTTKAQGDYARTADGLKQMLKREGIEAQVGPVGQHRTVERGALSHPLVGERLRGGAVTSGGDRFAIPQVSLLELVRLRMESLRLKEAVSGIRLIAAAIAPLELRQQELFESDITAPWRHQLSTLVDRLSNRLGRRAVLKPWLLSDAQPEHACQYVPLAGQIPQPKTSAEGRKKKSKKSWAGFRAAQPGAGQRPLSLWAQPAPIDVVSVAPRGRPGYFRWRGRQHRIARAWGPERIETAWWRTRCVRRDYYQVETHTGHRYWLFRHLPTGDWFLQGEFE